MAEVYITNSGVDIARPGPTRRALKVRLSGGDLLSRGFATQVPSALSGFTSVFGMGTGGSPTLWPPDNQITTSKIVQDSLSKPSAY